MSGIAHDRERNVWLLVQDGEVLSIYSSLAAAEAALWEQGIEL